MSQSAVHVYDVWAKSAAGRTIHFDVLLPVQDAALALQSAKAWPTSIGEENASVSAQTRSFCHTEAVAPPAMAEDLQRMQSAKWKDALPKKPSKNQTAWTAS